MGHGWLCRFAGSGNASQGLNSLALSPGGKLLASPYSDDGGLTHLSLWDVHSGQERAVLVRHTGSVSYLAFSPDGRTLASTHREGRTGSDEHVLRLWDMATGQERASLRPHTGAILTLAFSQDGRHLVTGSADTTLLVWDVAALLRASPIQPIRPTGKEVETAWAALAGGDAKAAHQAIHVLASAPELAMPVLRERLRPAAVVAPERIAQWIKELDSSRFDMRELATREMENADRAAVPLLEKALAAKPSPELRRRGEQLLKKIHGPVTSPEVLRALRGVEVLERLATVEAAQVLRTLADGAAAARLTREAKAALRVVEQRRTAAP